MSKDIFLYVLSLFIIGCTIGMVAIFVYVPIPKENHDVIVNISGAVTTWGAGVVGYWIGSSVGSAKKTDLLATKTNP